MNYGDKLDKEVRRIIDKTPYLNCRTTAGDHNRDTNGMPIIRDTDET